MVASFPRREVYCCPACFILLGCGTVLLVARVLFNIDS